MKEPSVLAPAEVQSPSREVAQVGGLAGETFLSLLLLAGLVGAALLLGVAWLGALHSGQALQVVTTFPELWRGEAQGWDRLATWGLLLLGVTPVARVACTIPLFARSGERGQAWIAAAVLALLLLGAWLT